MPPPSDLGTDPAAVADDILRHGWSTIPHFLPPADVLALETETWGLWHAGAFREAGIGRGHAAQRRPDIRADRILWLDDIDASGTQRAYFTRMDVLRLDLEQRLFLGLASLEAHLAVYPVGATYRRHRDVFAGTVTRVLSTVLYLNRDWQAADGGVLRLYPPDEAAVDILPLAGTLALFLSDVEHEVLPAARDRLSLTGWFLRR